MLAPGIDLDKEAEEELGEGRWQVRLRLASENARAFGCDEVFVGYGGTKEEASWDAITAATRALTKLSASAREALMSDARTDGPLIGASLPSTGEFIATESETDARLWKAAKDAERAEREW